MTDLEREKYAIDVRLINLEAELRWLASQDRAGDYYALERAYRNPAHAHAERARIRRELQCEHQRLTLAYVQLCAPLSFAVIHKEVA